MSEAHHLDARDLKCPLPVLRARKAMKQVPVGGLLEVQATDPSAPADFEAFCETTGHTLEASQEAEGIYTLRIRKTG
ncbi:sulfurtransferase TusA family protein [Rhodovibrio salinarum]|uniref:SirA family protein n=1 Tax=Rhodovibrio salinarum TaxID=1087 RepID=A0A934QHS0_9PROT|nr:sulfurtransferase TusA family protein [Rhodovibrio salinarum]MBK1697268.1 SirA family protein [Rhodovibrio salinarum]